MNIAVNLLNNANGTGYLDKLMVEHKLMGALAINESMNEAGILAVAIMPKLLIQSYSSAEKMVWDEINRVKNGDFSDEMFNSLKLEQSGVKFATPTVNKINALPEAPNEVAERMLLIERLGGVLKYSDVADRVFRSNLLMIDLHFPRVLTEMVRIMHLDDITRISELTEVIKQMNPLKIKDELVNKHGFYEFKVKQFLMALALGMRPAKIYTGQDSAVEGILLMDGSGEVLCYHKSEKPVMEDFLFLNTRLEKGSLDKDKYGFLERENGTYYFKLNAKIGLVKR